VDGEEERKSDEESEERKEWIRARKELKRLTEMCEEDAEDIKREEARQELARLVNEITMD